MSNEITRKDVIQAQNELTRVDYMLVNGNHLFADYGVVVPAYRELIRMYDQAQVKLMALKAQLKKGDDGSNSVKLLAPVIPNSEMVQAGIDELLSLSPEIKEAYNSGDLPKESLSDYVVFTYQAMIGFSG